MSISRYISEKIHIRTRSDGSRIIKVTCPKGTKKKGTTCVPMDSWQIRKKKHASIKSGLTHIRNPRSAKRGSAKRRRANRR